MKKAAIVAVLSLIAFWAWAEIEIEYTTPNIVVADENGTPVPGVSGSQNVLNATQKVIQLRKDGVYKLVRPSITMEVTGNEAGVIVPPPPPPVDLDGDGIDNDDDLCPGTPPATGKTIDGDGCYVITPPPPPPPTTSDLIVCPDEPTSTTASRIWTVCDITSADKPEYTANGSNYKMSYRIPTALTPDNKGQLYVYMHPSTSGDQFVTGSSSFDYSSKDAKKQIEIHTLEQTVGKSPAGEENGGGWWGYSGYDKGTVDNFNGKQLAASIKYVIDNHSDLIDLSKGLKLAGTSLGGHGAYFQALHLEQLLADLDVDLKVSIAISWWGIQDMNDADEAKVKNGWGTKAQSPDLWSAASIVQNWQKVQNVHFHWAGGQNDGSGRISSAWNDTCELRKISCSMRWLQSGHGPNESGYDLPHAVWLDPNQNTSLDVILPVFTNNTADHNGLLRGWRSRGISWDYVNIVDSVNEIRVPLRYVTMKNIGPDLPDQPDIMTADVTLRHVHNFDTQVGLEVDWEFGVQSGTTTVGGDGLLTIKDVDFENVDAYTVLIVKKHNGGAVVVPPVDPPTGALTVPIVYSWVKRTNGTHTVTLTNGQPYTSNHFDWMDKLFEVSRQYTGFNAPGQMDLLHLDGSVDVIFDCFVAPIPCVPMDANVSLDGTKIAFAVYQGDLVHTHPANRKYPNMVLGTKNSESRIYVYNIESKALTAWPHVPGSHDTNPVWLPGGKMAFSSNRAGFWQPRLNKVGTGANPEPRLYLADQDGSNAVDISPHELSGVLHPHLLLDGRLIYSAKWMNHNLAYKTGSQFNWPGTTGNKWPVMVVNQDGGDFVAALGAHQTRLIGLNDKTNTRKALHFLGQMEDGSILAENYYRANNLGLGDILIASLLPHGIEGNAPSFNPPIRMSATWSHSEDSQSFKDENGMSLGKTGHPEGVGGNQIMMTVGRGICTQLASGFPATNDILEATGDIGCDTGIYRTSIIPSQHPDDLVKLVDDPNRHEFMAKEVRSRDIPIRLSTQTNDGTCQLASSDAGSTDALHYGGTTPCEGNPSLNCDDHKFNKDGTHMANNGSLMAAVSHKEMTGIRFWQILGNPTKKEEVKNSIGNEVLFLGDAPLLADKSFKVQLPCDMAYIMGGIDKDGRLIKRDQVPQSLRPGEKRVCAGCHLHSRQGKPYEQSLAFNVPALPLLTPTPVPTYTKDILPILLDKCSGCHDPAAAPGEDVPLYTYQGLALDYFQELVPASMKVRLSNSTNEKLAHGIQRPWLSKYVNTMYASESLLFWKMVNERRDRRTDDTHTNDFDFGADHPTTMTPAEIDIAGHWLESGATK